MKWFSKNKPPFASGSYLTYRKGYGFAIYEYYTNKGGLDGRKAGEWYDLDNDGNCSMSSLIDFWTVLPDPPICETCDGRGVIGGFVSGDSGYQDDPCPDCQ